MTTTSTCKPGHFEHRQTLCDHCEQTRLALSEAHGNGHHPDARTAPAWKMSDCGYELTCEDCRLLSFTRTITPRSPIKSSLCRGCSGTGERWDYTDRAGNQVDSFRVCAACGGTGVAGEDYT